jgi:hypothetical protein
MRHLSDAICSNATIIVVLVAARPAGQHAPTP